jgi:hypothetical protein
MADKDSRKSGSAFSVELNSPALVPLKGTPVVILHNFFAGSSIMLSERSEIGDRVVHEDNRSNTQLSSGTSACRQSQGREM